MRSVNPLVALVGGILIGLGGGVLLSQDRSVASEVDVRNSADECEQVRVVAAPVPAPHIANAVRLMAAADSERRSVWFDQELSDGKDRRHLFFFRHERPNSLVEVGATIGVVSFILEDDGSWRPELVEPVLFSNGTRGEVTPQSQFRFERVSGDLLLMIVHNHLDTFEGAERYLDLFLVQDGRFSNAGRVFAGAHNKEMSCDGPTALRAGYNRACMDFVGNIELVPLAGQPLASLRVTFSGQGGDRNPELAPAIYRYSQTQRQFVID